MNIFCRPNYITAQEKNSLSPSQHLRQSQQRKRQASHLFLVRESQNTDKNFKGFPKNFCNLQEVCLLPFSDQKTSGNWHVFCREFGHLGRLRTAMNREEHQHKQFMDHSVPSQSMHFCFALLRIQNLQALLLLFCFCFSFLFFFFQSFYVKRATA